KAAPAKTKAAKTTAAKAASKTPAVKAKAAAPRTVAKAAPKAKAAPAAKAPARKPAAKVAPSKAATGKPAAPKAGVAKTAQPKAPVAKAAARKTAAPASAPQQRAMAAAGKAAPAKVTAPVANKAASAANGSSDPKKQITARHGFKTNELIVYPAHGVGRIIGIEEQEIAGMTLELFVIEFEKDKMTLRVPTSKSDTVGMRKLAEDGIVTRALDTLKGRARIKRTMWSRRAQEYEAKINSGDLVAIAEVVRDLYRSEAQPEQSYSERQLYEAALDRMARELAAVERSDERSAMQRITEILSKSARGRRAAADAAASAEGDGGDEAVKAA
ncbi:MAG: CarD family transcriptional regulator, partial [Hyphomicrobiaceae bacterium]